MSVETEIRSKSLARLPERLHHFAFVIDDQEKNRRFFEDVLGIPLVATWCEKAHFKAVGREIEYCHTFYNLGNGGALAFFQFAEPDVQAQLRPRQPETGYHIALKVDAATYADLAGRLGEARHPFYEVDHGYCQSLYTASPDGLRIEFTVDPPDVDEIAAIRRADCHSELERWLAGDRSPNNDIRHG